MPEESCDVDLVTGLLQRRPFVAQLEAPFRAETQPGSGLLLVRLRQLEEMNLRLGHEATDQLLAAALTSNTRLIIGTTGHHVIPIPAG